jgi:hypothetical protein
MTVTEEDLSTKNKIIKLSHCQFPTLIPSWTGLQFDRWLKAWVTERPDHIQSFKSNPLFFRTHFLNVSFLFPSQLTPSPRYPLYTFSFINVTYSRSCLCLELITTKWQYMRQLICFHTHSFLDARQMSASDHRHPLAVVSALYTLINSQKLALME